MPLKRILREPLLHFFLLGALLFGLFSWVNDDGMRAPDEIVVDAARVGALRSQFERVWQRPPTPAELSGLVDNWVREEILYREGIALGLDRNDPVLRRRVAQKIEFISEDMVSTPPTERQLEDWFEKHADDYRLEPRFFLRQVYFDPADHGESLDAAIETARAELAGGREAHSDQTLLPAEVSDASLADVRRTFGEIFADSLLDLPVGEWVGPVASGYGQHLVRIERKEEARLPEFAEARAAVERDFRTQRTRELKDAFYESLRRRYTVTFEDGITRADERDGADSPR